MCTYPCAEPGKAKVVEGSQYVYPNISEMLTSYRARVIIAVIEGSLVRCTFMATSGAQFFLTTKEAPLCLTKQFTWDIGDVLTLSGNQYKASSRGKAASSAVISVVLVFVLP